MDGQDAASQGRPTNAMIGIDNSQTRDHHGEYR